MSIFILLSSNTTVSTIFTHQENNFSFEALIPELRRLSIIYAESLNRHELLNKQTHAMSYVSDEVQALIQTEILLHVSQA